MTLPEDFFLTIVSGVLAVGSAYGALRTRLSALADSLQEARRGLHRLETRIDRLPCSSPPPRPSCLFPQTDAPDSSDPPQ